MAKNGWLVAPRSVEQLADALQFLLAHSDCRRALGQSARRRIQERFTPTQQSALVSQLYENLVRQRAPSRTC